jgi:hypothetical protein
MAAIATAPSGTAPRDAPSRAHPRRDGGGDLIGREPVLGATRAGKARPDPVHVDLEDVGVARRGRRIEPERLALGVGANEGEVVLAPSRRPEIPDRLPVDRKVAGRRAVFRCHVGDDGTLAGREAAHAGTEELDELAGHAPLPQALGHREGEVGGKHALPQGSRETDPDHVGDPEHDGHAEHHALGLEPAHAPGQYADPVDHRGVAVRAHEGVGDRPGDAVTILGRHDRRQPFEVDRVHDPRAGRVHADALQRAGRPLHEPVALGVAMELALHVPRESVRGAVPIDRDGVVDRHVHRQDGVEQRRVLTRLGERVPHAGDVHESRHACGVVHQDPVRREGNLGGAGARREPAAEGGECRRGRL